MIGDELECKKILESSEGLKKIQRNNRLTVLRLFQKNRNLIEKQHVSSNKRFRWDIIQSFQNHHNPFRFIILLSDPI